MVLWGFPRRFGRFGWEPSQLSSGGVRVKVVVRGSFRGSSFPFSFSLSGLPAGRPAGRVGRGGHPESPLERADWGGSPGPKPRRWLRAGREPVAVVGGRAGAAGGLPRGAAVGGFRGGLFPPRGRVFRRRHIFALFRQKGKITNRVVFDTFRIRRRRAGFALCAYVVALFRRAAARAAQGPVFFAPGAFFGTAPPARARRRGLFRGPRPLRPPAPRPAKLRHFALGKSDPPGLLSNFALQKSDRRGRLSHFALEKSHRRGRLCRFALRKSARPAFALRSGEVRPPWSAFALCSEEVQPTRSAFALCSEEVSSPRGASDPCAPLLGDRGPLSREFSRNSSPGGLHKNRATVNKNLK